MGFGATSVEPPPSQWKVRSWGSAGRAQSQRRAPALLQVRLGAALLGSALPDSPVAGGEAEAPTQLSLP